MPPWQREHSQISELGDIKEAASVQCKCTDYKQEKKGKGPGMTSKFLTWATGQMVGSQRQYEQKQCFHV